MTGSAGVRGGNADIVVVIAAFNEGPSIQGVVADLRERYPRVVVVDDGSRDDTSARARAAGATVLRHAFNRGQGAALQSGITFAVREQAEVIVTFDADGQHRPEDIEALVRPIREGRVEIALGSRFLDARSNVPVARRVLLACAILFTRLTSGVTLTDAHNGLRAFSRRAAEHLDIHLDRMAHASELIDQVRQSRLPFTEVPVNIRYTEYSMATGQSSWSALRILWDYVLSKVIT